MENRHVRTGILPAVEHVIEDLDAQMGHADLVDVREAHGETDIHFVFVLHYRIDLASDVAGGLFNI